eukprot:m.163887 g.163887  ORF g.163887 m.163887 type:complete len:117 (-) comp9881_c0_seq3:86-436(-)
MTTVKTFQGYSQDRATSRVLAPPGGKSSIFFSDEPEKAAPKQQAAPAPAQPVQAAPAPAPVAAPAPAAYSAHQQAAAASPSRGGAVQAAPIPWESKPKEGYRVLQPPGGKSSNIFG